MQTTEMFYQRMFYMECQKIIRELRTQGLFLNTDSAFAKTSPMPLIYSYADFKQNQKKQVSLEKGAETIKIIIS